MKRPPQVKADLRFEDGTLLLSDLKGAVLESLFESGFWVWDRRRDCFVCDALHWPLVSSKLGIKRPGGEVPSWSAVKWGKAPNTALRDDQQQAVEAWEHASHCGLVVMPTGTGKTRVALEIMKRHPCATLIVAPIRDLMYQWHREILRHLGYDAGVIGDNTFNLKAVSVTTYQSAAIHMPRLGNHFELVIWDECHHLPGPTLADSARMSMAPMRLGLTATPERSDGRHRELYRLIGPTVFDLPLDSAVSEKQLADYVVKRITVDLSEADRKRFDALGRQVSDYMKQRKDASLSVKWEDVCADSWKDAQARAAIKARRTRKAIEDHAPEKLRVVEDLFRLHSTVRCIIFTGSNRMARKVSEKFLIPCILSHCGKKERLDVLGGFEEGRYPAIVANQVLDEGVDLPSAKVGMVIGGFSSTRQAKQRLGRILRRSGNLRATLYEIVCNDTGEVKRSRSRRRSDAYKRKSARHT